MSQPQDEPKIIVDSDWKEQVAKEKELAGQPADESEQTADIDQTAPEPTGDEIPPPPPASFEVLISMLFTQAMSMLGQIPDPQTGKTSFNKPYAKHTIDTLEMLEEKTKGNLSDDEAKMISEALHALRMAYVGAKG